MRDSFILYTNYFDIFENVSNEDCGIIFKAILNYTKNDIVEIPPHLELAFKFIKNQLDIDNQKYNEIVEKRRVYGKKGAEAKAEKQKANEANAKTNKQKLTNAKNSKHNVNDNDNVTDNDTVTDTDNDNSLSHDCEVSFDVLDEREKKILFDFVKKQGAKSPRAYIKKLLQNGDFKGILKEEIQRIEKLKKSQDEREPPNPPRAPTQKEIENVNKIIAKIKKRTLAKNDCAGDDG